MKPRSAALCFAIALLAAAPAARAQNTSNKAAADTLYDQAKKLMAAGDFEAACPKLAESQRLDPGVGTLLTLGECYDRTGRKASAWATFREAAALATTRGQRPREKIARTRAASLEPRLSTLVITVPAASDAEGLAVLRDDEPVGKALWGTPVPLDGGDHTIVARAPGHKAWTTKVHVDTEKQAATVTVPALALEEVKPPPPRPTPDDGARAGRGSTQRALGFVAGGVGLAGIGVGVGLGLYATSKHNDAQTHCKPTCAAGGGDVIQADAKKIALGSTVAFIAGGTLLAGGVLLVLTAPSAKASSTAVRVAPILAGDVRGAMIGGVF